jgi:tape measure domain-containing protein
MFNESVIDIKIVAKDVASDTIGSVRKKLKGLGPTLSAIGGKAIPIIGKVAGAIGRIGMQAVKTGVLITSGLVAAFVGIGTKAFLELEQIEVGLETVTGSAQKATAVMNQMREDAIETPFSVKSLSKLNQMLLSTGLSADRSRELILNLGEAVSATGGGNEELSRMAVNLQQIKNLGHATSMDLRQFAFAGIDIYGLLAEEMGVARKEVQKMEASEITFQNIEDALAGAAEEGGRFAGAMEKQANTLRGRWEAFTETIELNAAAFLESSGTIDLFKNSLQFASNFASDFFVGLERNAPIVQESMQELQASFAQIAEDLGIVNGQGKGMAEVFGEKVALAISSVIDFVRTFGESVAEYAPQVTGNFSTIANNLSQLFTPAVNRADEEVAGMTIDMSDNRSEAERMGNQAGDIAGGGLTLLSEMLASLSEWWIDNKKRISELITKIDDLATKIGPIIDKISNLLGVSQQTNSQLDLLEQREVPSGVAFEVDDPMGRRQEGQSTFSTGGIVPGQSISGDRLTARVNSGEMILNRSQQQNLFKAIQSGKTGGNGITVNFNGEMRVDSPDRVDELVRKIELAIGDNIKLEGLGG